MGCIPAKTCRKALNDATERWPSRNRASDGICGDSAHQARKSDHNLGNAYDLTHDLARGVDCAVLSRQVIHDNRVTYVIFAGQIYRTYKPELGWAKYTGPNSHHHHMHVSIKPDARDNLAPWPWSQNSTTVVEIPERRTLRLGVRGEEVKNLQKLLGLEADGVFGSITEKKVKEFQTSAGLQADGVVGRNTWKALLDKEK